MCWFSGAVEISFFYGGHWRTTLIAEFSKRRVFRVISGYAVVCFVTLQIADVTFEPLEISDSVLKVIIAVMLVALPIVAYVAWVFDVGPDAEVHKMPGTRAWLEALIAGVAVLIFGVGCWMVLIPNDRSAVAPPTSVEVQGVEESTALSLDDLRADEVSIAVMPFDNLSDSPDNAYFAAGTHEDLLINLTQLSGLRVVARSSVIKAQEVAQNAQEFAQMLGADYLVEGSVRRSGETILLTVKLTSVADDRQLWAARYNRKLTDVFAIQRDIATAVAAQLKLQFDLHRRNAIATGPTNASTYDLYLQARQLGNNNRTRPDIDRAIAILDLVIEQDPEFAEGYAQRSFLRNVTGLYGEPWSEIREQVISDARHALSLQPQSYEARLSWARALHYSQPPDQDLSEAEAQYRQAITINPGRFDAYFFLSQILVMQDRIDEAAAMAERAHINNPLNALTNSFFARIRGKQGRYEEARVLMLRAADLAPSASVIQAHGALLFLGAGDVFEGLRFAHKAAELDPRNAFPRILLAENFMALEDFTTAHKWAEQALNVNPDDAYANITLVRMLRTQERIREMRDHVEGWQARFPDERRTLHARAMLATALGFEAQANGDVTAYQEHTQKAFELWAEVVAPHRSKQGNLKLYTFNGALVLAYGLAGRQAGHTSISDQALKQVALFYQNVNKLRSSRDPYGGIARGIALAALGELEAALLSLEQASESGDGLLWILKAYRIDNPHSVLFRDLAQHPRYLALVEVMQRRDDRTLQRLKEEIPEVFQ